MLKTFGLYCIVVIKYVVVSMLLKVHVLKFDTHSNSTYDYVL